MIQVLGFPYSSLGAVSLVTYFTVGLMGAWRAHFRHRVIAAVIVGFPDATSVRLPLKFLDEKTGWVAAKRESRSWGC